MNVANGLDARGGIGETVATIAVEAIDRVGEGVNNVIDLVIDKLESAYHHANDTLETAVDQVSQTIEDAVSSDSNFFGGLYSSGSE